MIPAMNIAIHPVTIPIRDDLELRQRQPAEAEELFALTDKNRVYLRRWLPWVDHCQSPADTRSHIEITLRQAEEGTGLAMSIWHQDHIVGVTGYHEILKDNRIGHIGYWLGAEHAGKVLMTASVRALVDYGFRELGLNRQIIAAATGNLRSRALAERLGFPLEGIAREAEWLYDHFVDHAVYALLKEDQPVAGHTPGVRPPSNSSNQARFNRGSFSQIQNHGRGHEKDTQLPYHRRAGAGRRDAGWRRRQAHPPSTSFLSAR